ncbi:hypothetical protein UFOVP239_34 [uncultured Caudovirales phage]|uniref:Uncharacterized protein n=1 Tax=uncultured Caudovirales phage TaxID=2100421 RepID=A0A6J7WQI7_9CAUD|nr:hypothetical protein UFOVP239_34 [uncultured Caudovirales phage]
MKNWYTHWDVLLASPTEPLPAAKRRYQLTRMWGGLRNIETAPMPSVDDWSTVSDAINLMETLVEMDLMQDPEDLVGDAIAAMAKAGNRSIDGRPIRLDGGDIKIVRGLLEDYSHALETIPARVMVQAHRITEKRIQEILAKKKIAKDVVINE